MATSMEVNGSKLTSMDVGGRFHGWMLVEAYIDVSWWKLL